MILCRRAAFFCAIIILSGVAAITSARAQMNADPRPDFVTALDEDNIMAFLKEVGEISTGQRPDMTDEEVANYFNNHMADRGIFESKMHFEIPSFPAQDKEMKLNKQDYINFILQGRYMMRDYHSDIKIENLKIASNGTHATFTSIVTETGKMPFPKDKKKPDDVDIIPIEGKSKCEQRMIVSFNNFIQMANAECETSISFDPFGGKPLVPQ